MPASKQITVRNLPAEVAERLKRLSAQRGESLNTTVLGILKKAVGVDDRRRALARYATWTESDVREFDTVVSEQRSVDPGDWT